jgi:hypothetical protein
MIIYGASSQVVSQRKRELAQPRPIGAGGSSVPATQTGAAVTVAEFNDSSSNLC